MNNLLTVLLSLCTFILFSGCNKEKENAETRLALTAAQVKGKWRWTLVRNIDYDREGKMLKDRTSTVIAGWGFTFDGSMYEYSINPGMKQPYALTERDGAVLLTMSDSNPMYPLDFPEFIEILEISPEKMSWQLKYKQITGYSTTQIREYTKEL